MITSKMISERLSNEILSSGKSKSEIATLLGISKPTLSQYLSGRILPSLTTFANLCNILDISSDDILNFNK